MTALVVLPGLDGTATLHDAFKTAIAPNISDYIAVAYPANEVLSRAELVLRARSHLPKHQPFVLLGESFSGPIAIALAAENPEGLKALVLSTTFARQPLPLSSWLAPLARFGPVRSAPYPLIAWCLLGAWSNPNLDRDLRNALAQVAPAVVRSRAKIALETDVGALLPKITAPTLYLRASRDRLIMPRAAREIVAKTERARCEEIDGPHLLLQAAPRAAAEAIGRFLGEYADKTRI